MKLTADKGEHEFVIPDDAFHASGGEADIHVLGPYVLKVYRRPDAIPMHEPDRDLKVVAATRRLEEGPQKLNRFPLDLPPGVVAPLALLYDEGRFTGFLMPYIEARTLHDLLEDPATDIGFLVTAFRNLRTIMLAVHEAGVVVADVAPKNIMVAADGTVYLIDADSMQYGQFMSPAVTRTYTDPLRFGRARDPFMWPTPQSDWYGYAAMLFQALFRVRPFEGEMKPGKAHLEFEERVRRRITVFHNDVRLPATARPFNIVPAPVMDYFAALFERDVREPFRGELLDMLTWQSCHRHALQHARARCPQCTDSGQLRQLSADERRAYRPAAPEVWLPRRKPTCFTTSGRIVAVTATDRLRVLYRERGALYREHGRLVTDDWPPASFTVVERRGGRHRVDTRSSAAAAYAIRGGTSFIATEDAVRAYGMYGSRIESPLTTTAGRPMFGVNSTAAYVLSGRELTPLTDNLRLRRTSLSLPSSYAWMWMGERIGFVMSQGVTGNAAEGLFFDATNQAPQRIADVQIDRPSGDIRDVACYFGDDRVWLLIMVQTPAGHMRVQVRVYDGKGALLYKGRYPAEDYFRTIQGHAAVGKTLLVRDGTTLLRLTFEGKDLKLAAHLARALPFVQPQTWLLPATDQFGFAVHTDSITPITIPLA